MSGATRLYLVAAVAMALALLAAWSLLPIETGIARFADWIVGLGALGLAAFALIYLLTTLLMGPAWAVSVTAGVAFGLWGVLLVVPTATVAATVAFAIARYFARSLVSSYIRDKPRLEAIDQAVKGHGFAVVVLLRLCPALPFVLTNYALGLTDVSASAYVAATLIGITPGAFLFVYLGTIGRLAFTARPEHAFEWAVLIAGLAATIAVVVLLHRAARARLARLGID